MNNADKISVDDWIVSDMYYSEGYGINATINYGSTPNGLYKTIKNLKNAGRSGASTSYKSSPTSSNCSLY